MSEIYSRRFILSSDITTDYDQALALLELVEVRYRLYDQIGWEKHADTYEPIPSSVRPMTYYDINPRPTTIYNWTHMTMREIETYCVDAYDGNDSLDYYGTEGAGYSFENAFEVLDLLGDWFEEMDEGRSIDVGGYLKALAIEIGSALS